MSKLNSSLYETQTDQLGKKIEYDVREDDDQPKKLQEILELLVAAGYFRARIKGLSEFDKIVGGLTWCISTCNFDVDVDLLFQENLNIGLKIALTERIVAVLPRMKCPFRIEPHQIQGLDYIHIFPVVQWLVKRAIETRAEMGDLNRAFALSQFEKYNRVERDDLVKLKTVSYLKEVNAPKRKYARKDAQRINDKAVRIQSTLLEYGQKTYLTRATSEVLSSATNKATTVSLKQEQNEQQINAAKQAEEEQLKKLINEMSSKDQKTKLNASVVGQIIGFKQDELQELLSFYTNKDNELQQTLDQLDKIGELGGSAHKKRLVNVLNKQIEQRESEISEKKNQIVGLEKVLEKSREKFNGLTSIADELNAEIKKLEDLNNNADTRVIKKLEEYIGIYDTQKVKENEYKKKCKEELNVLKAEIENMNKINQNLLSSEDSEKYNAVLDQHSNFKSKIHGIKLKLAKKNREISLLQRKLDEIPSRTELSQYQKRFIELYNQISAGYTQTKQFFILYNGLDDKKVYMTKEINLLNSINEQFVKAMSSQNTRDQFLKQLEAIIEGIMQSLQKIENKKTDQKSKRDALNDRFVDLVDKKRIYYKAVKDFQDECKKNEMLLSKFQS